MSSALQLCTLFLNGLLPQLSSRCQRDFAGRTFDSLDSLSTFAEGEERVLKACSATLSFVQAGHKRPHDKADGPGQPQTVNDYITVDRRSHRARPSAAGRSGPYQGRHGAAGGRGSGPGNSSTDNELSPYWTAHGCGGIEGRCRQLTRGAFSNLLKSLRGQGALSCCVFCMRAGHAYDTCSDRIRAGKPAVEHQ